MVDNGSDEPMTTCRAIRADLPLFVESAPEAMPRATGALPRQGRDPGLSRFRLRPAGTGLAGKGCGEADRQPRAGAVGGRVDFSSAIPEAPAPVEIYDSLTSFKQKSYIEKSHFSGTGNLFTCRASSTGWSVQCRAQIRRRLEWGNRVFAHGIGIAYADDVRVTHPARQLTGPLLSKHRRVMGGISVPFSCPLTFLKGTGGGPLPLASTLAAIATDKRVGAGRERPDSRGGVAGRRDENHRPLPGWGARPSVESNPSSCLLFSVAGECRERGEVKPGINDFLRALCVLQ